jgi:hypothetical protein
MFASAFLLLAGLPAALAQGAPTSDPPNGATGVSVSAPVVFTFSSSVDPSSTIISFYSTSPPGSYTVNTNWNTGDTVVTCTPSPPFPANATINWLVVNTATAVFAQGSFSTGTNSTSGGGGSGTNAITSFVVGKSYLNQQLTAGPPTLETNESYFFTASTSLSSNRTANTITVTLPSLAVTNLQSFVLNEDYEFFAYDTNNARFESAFPEGNYVFNVMASASNQQVTVTLPASMAQPNAPHISNFTAAQSLNSTNPFTLTWDAFQGGTASDYIFVTVGGNVFQSSPPGTSNVLSGTATSVTIPAGTLAANSNYMSIITFFHVVGTTNASYSTGAYRATTTQFNIDTIGAASTVPVVSNPVWGGGGFSFDVATSPAQVLKVLYSTDCSLPIAQWQMLLTTNSTGTGVHITIPPQAGATGFFRLENGP